VPAQPTIGPDEIPDGIVIAGPDERVEAVNAAACAMLGVDPETAVGKDFRDVLPLADAQGRDWWACTRPYDGLATRTRQPERELTMPDGRAFLVTARYVRTGPSAPLDRLVVCLRSTTSRMRSERDSAELVATVAHELRSPLTSVKGFTATLLAKWERFNDEQKRVMLETVNADADRVTRLIGELLDVSRIDAGRLELHKQVVDIAKAVHRAVDGRIAAGEPSDRFVLDIAAPLPEIWADPDKLDQVLGNLVENALRHGAGTVTISVQPFGDGVEFVVTDEGDGIDEDAAQRVFKKFWRGASRGGTGLGLFIARGVVEAHGGSIVAERADSGGAQLRFSLPAGTPSFAV
jgi:signal transduction histidine kinase